MQRKKEKKNVFFFSLGVRTLRIYSLYNFQFSDIAMLTVVVLLYLFIL